MLRLLAASLLLAAGLAPRAAGAAVSASAASRSMANAWMRAHPSGDEDGMAELKAQNPEAYAIVTALMTKRSLGLLDPKHPSASFAAPAAEDVPTGAAAFARFASPSDAVAPAAASHHSWLNWKPQDSATDDDAMVQNVLGAVAELKGQKLTQGTAERNEPASPLEADADALGFTAASEAAAAGSTTAQSSKPEALVAEAALPDIAAVADAAASDAAEASSAVAVTMSGAPDDLVASPPPRAAVLQGNSYLRAASAVAATSAEVAATPKSTRSKSALSYWLLGGGTDEPADTAQPVKPPARAESEAKESNPYTVGLW